MKTSTVIVLGVVAVAVVAVGYLLLRPATHEGTGGHATFGEKLSDATGSVSDAIGDLGRLFG